MTTNSDDVVINVRNLYRFIRLIVVAGDSTNVRYIYLYIIFVYVKWG
jgi:hypothetical protein